jgi:hypothetical protein
MTADRRAQGLRERAPGDTCSPGCARSGRSPLTGGLSRLLALLALLVGG